MDGVEVQKEGGVVAEEVVGDQSGPTDRSVATRTYCLRGRQLKPPK